MAGAIAFSEITILDLIDTATYIYYAEDENGRGATSAPTTNTKYIGIYSGEPFNYTPSKFPMDDWEEEWWTGWQKYVGEDITIKKTSVKYIVTEDDVQPDTNDDKWQDSIPTTPQGSYLWTWTKVVYSNNSSTDTFSKSYLGKDANAYYIETNQEEVLIFKTSQGIQISPAVLKIKMYKLPLTSSSELIDFSENYSFGYIDSTGDFKNLITTEYAGYYSFGNYEEDETSNVFSYSIQDLINDHTDAIPSGTVLKFAYLENNEEIAIKVIPYQFGTSKDMAQFNIEATKINAAVRDAYLQFDEKGISLYVSGAETNAGLKIYKKTKDANDIETSDKVFWADERGNLRLKGYVEAEGGSFTGDIHATNASFENGTIGGFTIGSSLVSKDGGIVLNGSEGIIKASSIELGTGATIESYIRLGNAYLYNPNSADANGAVLRSDNIVINQNGTASFGKINIDGTNSRFYGENWSITPNQAEFSNITVSGSIETAVFKAATTQAIGSAMLFMQSYKIESINGQVVTVDQNVEKNISAGTLVWLVNNNNLYSSYTVQSVSGKDITLEATETIDEATAVIVIGEKDDKPLIFGANGGNVKVANDLIYQRGITINEYGNTGLPHLFLGDLNALNGSENINYTGYGLYSDNVYLNGSLTTKVGENSYAGVNTLNGVPAIAFTKDYEDKPIPQEIDTSKIVFWAGANSISAEDVQKAYFQVTEQGSIYASRAKLTSSLFVGGEIRGADIYTARIHGTGDSSSPALTIYDTSNGISFKSGYDNDKQSSGVETFSIQSKGLKVGKTNFISINDSQVTFIGDEIKTKGANYLSLTTRNSMPVLYHEHSAAQSCGFYFDNGKTSYKLTSNEDDNIKMIWSSNDVKILGAISFAKNETDSNFQYRPVDGGYDLYVIQ